MKIAATVIDFQVDAHEMDSVHDVIDFAKNEVRARFGIERNLVVTQAKEDPDVKNGWLVRVLVPTS